MAATDGQGNGVMDGGDQDRIGYGSRVIILRPPTLTVAPTHPLSRRRWRLYKRVQDIVLTLMILAVLAIPMLWIAARVKLDSKGPVFFQQRRRGRNIELFPCLKFRTMYTHCTDVHASEQTRRGDVRVTRYGSKLRKWSLDELPQLFNVLAGHMSLIGPRPHALGTSVNGRTLDAISEAYMLRYHVTPGMTGWAQVNGWRGILDTEEKLYKRLEHDLYYITHWTPWFDLLILLRTVGAVFDGRAF